MRKKRFIYALSAMLILGAPLALASCADRGNGDGPVNPTPSEKVEDFTLALSSTNPISAGETVSIIATPTNKVTGQFIYKVTEGDSFISVNTNGVVTGLAKGTGTVTVTCRNGKEGLAPKTISVECLGNIEKAVGAYNFVGKSYEEKLDILGKLEQYAVDNHLTGITLFQNGGYVMYNERINLPTDNYITGYGMGVLSEGSITKDMPDKNEPKAEWKRYYHSYGGTNNKQKFNYLDDTGSESADLYGYVSSTYYGTKMNSTKDGYDWYGVLAKENPNTHNFMPEPVNVASDGTVTSLNSTDKSELHTSYRVYVRTGQDGLKYNTLSSMRKSFVGRAVQLEDYVTPFRVLLNQNIGLARSVDMISDSSNSTLRGARSYYNQTKNNSNIEETKDIFDKQVGIKANPADNSITFTFNTPVNQFAAMTNLSSSLFSPIPADFIKEITKGIKGVNDSNIYKVGMKQAYGTVNSEIDTKPVDNLLSLAPYVLEQSDTTYNVYKRNPLWFEFNSSDASIKNRYSIEGIKIVYLAGASSDKNLAFNTYINGGLDACSIPKDYMSEYKDKPRTRKTQGDSTFKLNLNTTTQKEWDAIFGNGGTNPNGGQTWHCKPLMSNDNFVNALSFAIDRETFASTRGNIPSQSYFAPAYLWDPENGKSYDETAQHKAAIAKYSPDTYGYNQGLAIELFDKAIEQEVAKGNYKYTEGTKDKPSSETIYIKWMNTTDQDEYGKEIVKYFTDAFEKTEAYKKGFRLNFDQDNGNTDYQQVYNKMKAGIYDIGFGSISGMQTDPLGFMEVLKSNNSTGFTLNYGCNTGIIEDGTDSEGNKQNNYIIYDGKKWSFDSLWTAANKGGVIGDDAKIVKDPIIISQRGSGSELVNGYYQMAAQLTKQTTASGVNFKLFTEAAKKDNEYVTFNISYKDGNVTKALVVNKKLDSDWVKIANNSQSKVDADGNITSNSAQLVLNVPATLTSANTDGALGEGSVAFNKISSISIYVTYYLDINNVATSTTVDLTLKIK